MKKEKKYGLLKIVLLMILIAIVLSWLIPNGSLTATGLINDGMMRVGLNDLEWLLYYGLYMPLDKIIFLLVLGGVYGVISQIPAYKKLVQKIAKKCHKHQKITVVTFSVLIALLTSLLTKTFVVLIFIPFIISIMSEMKLDKMTILATSFGSILIGTIGATFGTEGLIYLGNYMTASDSTLRDTIYATVLIRAGILLIGLILFNFFTLSNIKKNAKADNESATMFELTTVEDKKSIIPLVIIGILTLVVVILGYTDWTTNFKINIFTDFHDFLYNKVKIGNDFYIIKSILGEYPRELGLWDLYVIPPIMLIFSGILALCYRINLTEFLTNFKNGLKKVIKPILVVFGAYALFTVVYMSPYVATIVDKFLNLSEGFNLATMLISSLIVNIFHVELGYSGYIFGAYSIAEYADYIKPIFVMLTSIYGLVQLFIPTSIFIGMGITTLNVKYKDWLKYIWKFLVGMFIILLIILILMTIL